MAARAVRTRTCAIAAIGSTLVVATVLLAWNRSSLGAYATISRADFADRFQPINISRPPMWKGTVLALLAPGSTIDDPGEAEMQTISPDAPDDIWSPYRLAVRPYRPATKAKAVQVAQAGQAVPVPIAPAAPQADFWLPDFGELVVPAAALSLMTLSLAELAAKEHAAAKSSRVSTQTFATSAPAANSFQLPGPFHVFFTTAPVGGTSDASAPAGGGSGGGLAAVTNGLTGGVNGLTSGVNGLTSGVSGLTSGVTGLTGGVGNTVGGVVGNVGSGVGNVLGVLRH
jgi:hypothetical protein